MALISVSGCGGTTPAKSTNLDKASAWRIAEQSATREGIELESYKRVEGSYLEDKGHWCMTYEERGYRRIVGDQFAVLVEDSSARARVLRGVGSINVGVQAKLEKEIAKLKTLPAGQAGVDQLTTAPE